MKKTTTITLASNKGLSTHVNVGFIQTVINADVAWPKSAVTMQMTPTTERVVWEAIKKGFSSLHSIENKPDIIVLPELTVPHGYVGNLKRLAQSVGAVVIAGLDFKMIGKAVWNKAIIITPYNWPSNRKSTKSSVHYWGKTFFSSEEKERIVKKGYFPVPDYTNYILDAGEFGKIGVAICADIFDIERFLIYRGRIQHFIIIAHNKDINSFYFLAEAISRLVFCNVVICNTGYYGDSLAFSLYKEDYERVIYRHRGQKLFTVQVVKLPVLELKEAQKKKDQQNKFKSTPPGYISR